MQTIDYIRMEDAVGRLTSPGKVPVLKNIDIAGMTMQLNGIGGDGLVFFNFNDRYDLDKLYNRAIANSYTDERQRVVAEKILLNKTRGGIAVFDIAGHDQEDSQYLVALHNMLLIGADFEMERYGEITPRVLEKINSRSCQSAKIQQNIAHKKQENKYVTMIYGEVSESGIFRFINAGHPLPVVFSTEYDKIIDHDIGATSNHLPFGIRPSHSSILRHKNEESLLGYEPRYEVNEWKLVKGDIYLLHTDGFMDKSDHNSYKEDDLERILSKVKHMPAKDICEMLLEDRYTKAEIDDDVTLVVIKKTA